MSIHPHDIRKNSMYRAVTVIIGIAVSVLLSFIMESMGTPLYLDTVGTIFVAALGGAFPGILTAVATNLICSLFNPQAVYYLLINILIAIATARFYGDRRKKKKADYVFLFICLVMIAGVLGTIFQYLLAGRPDSDTVYNYIYYMSGGGKAPLYPLLFLLASIVINMADKSVSLLLALLAIKIVSEDTKKAIRNSSWLQRPLSREEVDKINHRRKGSVSSLRIRTTILLMAAATLLVSILSWISVGAYTDSLISNGTKEAESAAKLVAGMFRPEMLEKYLDSREPAESYNGPGYREGNYRILNIKDSNPSLTYLYIYAPAQDGWNIIFDTDSNFQDIGVVGEHYDFEEGWDEKYLEGIRKGESIPPVVISKNLSKSVTVLVPIYGADGRCVAYAGADVFINTGEDFFKNYFVKTILAFSGFFVLIIAFGLWVSGHYLLYPIGSMAQCAEGFMGGIEDQNLLDEKVRELKSLDIRTNDEVETLYKSICAMAGDTAEQMRNIRLLAQTTSSMQRGLIITMADMVENRDSDTGAHVQKTSAYVRIILDGLKRKGYYAEKLTEKYMNDVEMSAPLHDVGKIHIPDSILNKPDKLTEEEFEIMKTHTIAGKRILEHAIETVEGGTYLKEARNMAAYHHERWDGTGYPEGLHGQVIPLSARIMAVADVFDALTSSRVY
ncbi:MAG: HD domain-containing protein, partial [Lachnospiraceae bacterium]|nr:HD domain-containing protein [Lachnospiraceae bacterium]